MTAAASSISPMRSRGLRPAAELAASRPHGDRVRYLGGCRCSDCRRANTDYEKQRAAARKAGDWNGVVSTSKARAHVASLSAQGVGYKQVADAAGVPDSTMFAIVSGTRTGIRGRTERAILAVTKEAAADRALVDAAPTWKLLNELLAFGYSKTTLAHELGYESHALQIGQRQCTVRNAHEVSKLHERRRRMPECELQRLVTELRAEGYRPDRITAMANELAARKGLPPPDLNVYRGYVSAIAVEIVRELHEELTGEPA